MIVTGGINVYPRELEVVLEQHPSVGECTVIGVPDEKWGEHPCAFVTLKSESKLTEQEAIAFCRTKLAGFKIPKMVMFGELPKTSTGKVRKNELREQAKALG